MIVNRVFKTTQIVFRFIFLHVAGSGNTKHHGSIGKNLWEVLSMQ